jgi:SAM-dependent methyltransferase
MEMMKYYEVSHRCHTLFNPMSMAKFERLCGLFKLDKGARVLDIACGSGEYLVRLAELYDIKGVGVDISKAFLEMCRQRKQARVPEADIEFLEMDGASYTPDENFHLAMCIGADWIWKGVLGTIRAIKDMTRDGGLMAIGSPYWLKEPSKEYLKMAGIKRDDYGWFDHVVGLGEKEGLSCIHVVASDLSDWDHYESLQWWAVDDHIKQNPDDPDNEDLLGKAREFRGHYLGGGREFFNWAIYVFRK